MLCTFQLNEACNFKEELNPKIKLDNFFLEKIDIFCLILNDNQSEANLLNSILIETENNLDNYVTSCWECNLKFGNKTHEEGKPQPNPISSSDVKWDGLSSLYPKLLDKDDKWSDIINNS